MNLDGILECKILSENAHRTVGSVDRTCSVWKQFTALTSKKANAREECYWAHTCMQELQAEQQCESQQCESQQCESQQCESQQCESQQCESQQCESQQCESQQCESQQCESQQHKSSVQLSVQKPSTMPPTTAQWNGVNPNTVEFRVQGRAPYLPQ
jgi:hypothetical protein